MTFGERLKILIEESQLDQKDFGKLFNLSPSTVSGYITGYRTPSDELKIKFADYFNVSVDWLLGRTNVRNPHKSDSSKQYIIRLNTSDFPQEAIEQIEEYIEFIKQKYAKKNQTDK